MLQLKQYRFEFIKYKQYQYYFQTISLIKIEGSVIASNDLDLSSSTSDEYSDHIYINDSKQTNFTDYNICKQIVINYKMDDQDEINQFHCALQNKIGEYWIYDTPKLKQREFNDFYIKCQQIIKEQLIDQQKPQISNNNQIYQFNYGDYIKQQDKQHIQLVIQYFNALNSLFTTYFREPSINIIIQTEDFNLNFIDQIVIIEGKVNQIINWINNQLDTNIQLDTQYSVCLVDQEHIQCCIKYFFIELQILQQDFIQLPKIISNQEFLFAIKYKPMIYLDYNQQILFIDEIILCNNYKRLLKYLIQQSDFSIFKVKFYWITANMNKFNQKWKKINNVDTNMSYTINSLFQLVQCEIKEMDCQFVYQ